MTDLVRSVGVRLSANTAEYLGKMRAAGAETEAVSNRMTRTVKANGLTQERVYKAVGTAAKYSTGLVVVGLFEATKTAADFGEKMALVKTLSSATDAQMQALSKTALTLGQNIGYSAIQVADGEAELVKAGISVKDIMGGALKGALDLAAAGQTDVATATEIAASAMTQFKLKGKDVPHIADLLAAGADKALGSVEDLGLGLKQVGTTADQMGFSIEATTGTLAEFAQAGLIGERGGTTLKQMLLQLAAPTNKAADLMEQYHLSLYKANGQIKTMPQLADNLQKSLGKLTPAQRNYALGVIFGSRAIQGANILLKDGAKANAEWIRKVNDQGFAAHQASGKLDSLKGDLNKLKSATQSAFIELGSGTQSPLREFVQNTTKKIREVTENGDLAKWAHEAGHELKQLGRDAEPLARAVGGTLKNLGHDAEAVAHAFNSLPAGVQKMIVTGGALAYGANKLGLLKPLVNELKGGGAAGALGGTVSRGVVPVFVTNLGAGGALGAGEAAAGAGAAGRGAAAGAEGAGFLAGLKSILSGKGAGSVTAKGLGLGTLAGLAVGSFTLGGAGSEVRGPKSDADLRAMLQGAVDKKAADSARDAAKAAREQAAAQAGLNLVLRAGQKQLPGYAKALKSLPPQVRTEFLTPGALQSRGEIRELGHQYNLTPRQIRTLVTLSGLPKAASDLASLRAQLSGLHDKTIDIVMNLHQQGTPATGLYPGLPAPHPPKHKSKTPAAGGYISGPGTSTSDSIPAWLSDGEYVMPASTVAHYGLDTMERMRAKRFAQGGPVGGLHGYITRDLDLKFPSTLKQWNNALDKSRTAIDKERSARDDLVSKRNDYATGLTDSLRKDPFSTDRPDSFSYFTGAQRTAYLRNNPVTVANQNATTGAAYQAALSALRAKGLGGAAFSQLAATGDLEQVQAIAGESKAQLAVLQRSVGAGNAATSKVGKYAGGIVFNPQIDKTNAHLSTMVGLQHELVTEVKRAAARNKASKRSAAAKARTRKKGP